MNLYNGSIHELSKGKDEYRIIDYETYNITIPVENMTLNRKNSTIRGDREMNYSMIVDKIDFFDNKMNLIKERISNRIEKELKFSIMSNNIIKENILKTIEDFKIQKTDSLKKNNPIEL